jgi:hypothetical protein
LTRPTRTIGSRVIEEELPRLTKKDPEMALRLINAGLSEISKGEALLKLIPSLDE